MNNPHIFLSNSESIYCVSVLSIFFGILNSVISAWMSAMSSVSLSTFFKESQAYRQKSYYREGSRLASTLQGHDIFNSHPFLLVLELLSCLQNETCTQTAATGQTVSKLSMDKTWEAFFMASTVCAVISAWHRKTQHDWGKNNIQSTWSC